MANAQILPWPNVYYSVSPVCQPVDSEGQPLFYILPYEIEATFRFHPDNLPRFLELCQEYRFTPIRIDD